MTRFLPPRAVKSLLKLCLSQTTYDSSNRLGLTCIKHPRNHVRRIMLAQCKFFHNWLPYLGQRPYLLKGDEMVIFRLFRVSTLKIVVETNDKFFLVSHTTTQETLRVIKFRHTIIYSISKTLLYAQRVTASREHQISNHTCRVTLYR